MKPLVLPALSIALIVAAQGAVRAQRPAPQRPDLQGTWNASTLTPLQRPAAFKDRAAFTPEEAAEWVRSSPDRVRARLPGDDDRLFQADIDESFVETEAIKLDASPEVLDTLWGYYFASGSYGPISRILRMLTWSKDRDDTERLTVGNMAKYTLASNAARDADLLAMLKQGLDRQPSDIQPILKEVIEAAETMEIAHIRKAALASIEDLKRKGPGYKRDISTWGQLGQGAVALGCIAAAATGQVEIGIPCVVGGALSSATPNYWGKD